MLSYSSIFSLVNKHIIVIITYFVNLLCIFIFFDILFSIGPVAHLVEHIICNDGVAGSSPVGSTEKSPL